MSWIEDLVRRVGGGGARVDRTPILVHDPAPAAARVTAPEQAEAAGFPRFQSTAGDQVDPHRSDNFSSVRLLLRKAFTPSQPITDRRMYAGRTGALAAIIRAIEDQRVHVVVHGERGVGKTSTLNILTQAAREARYLVIYISCGAGSTFDEVFRAVCTQIPLMFHSGYGPTNPAAERGGSFADLLSEARVTTRLAGEIFAKVVGTRILVILDEFDRAESEAFRTAIGELMKDISDRSVRVQLVIAGVAANLTELLEHIPSIQRNVFALQLPTMNADEVRALVEKGGESSGLTFEEAAKARIVTLGAGFPYLASLISHHSGLAALDAQRLTVNAGDVKAAADAALLELKGRVSRRSQLQILDAVSHGALGPLGSLAAAALSTGGKFTLDDVKAAHAKPAETETRRKLMETLASESVLIQVAEDEYGRRYRFIEQSVPAYLWLLSQRAQDPDAPAPA